MEIYKLILITGLLMDGIGVYILLKNEIKNRQIEESASKGHSPEDDEWTKKNIIEGRGVPFYNKVATALRIIHPHEKSTNLSKWGLRFLLFGFGFQILGTILT